MASSLARPPVLRITWASLSARPAYFAGSRRASIQVRIAKWRLGGSGRLAFSPKFSAYLAFAASTSSRILVTARPSCSELSKPEDSRKICAVLSQLSLLLSSPAEPPYERHGLALPDGPESCRPSSHQSAAGSYFEAPSRDPRFIRGLQ